MMFPAGTSETAIRETNENVRKAVADNIGKAPAAGGAFGTHIVFGDLSENIGGPNETNRHFTRRALFMTEGLALGPNKPLFEQQKQTLIDRYIQDGITDHQLALFFLNDMIRYYRTICVDFEFKTVEEGKDWGLRNIKLIFSRKLLYFSGLVMAAETFQRSVQEKRSIISNFMDLCVIDRVIKTCGTTADRALQYYDEFLGALSQEDVREKLRRVHRGENHPEIFRSLKNSGHHFTLHLLAALRGTYPSVHPIHRAITF